MKTFNKLKLIPISLLFVAPLASCNNSDNAKEGKLVTYDVTGGVCVASLSNRDRSKITNITVPNKIDGKKVVEISKGAFKSCTSLRSISLPFIGHTYDGQGIGGLFGYIFGDEMYEGGGAYTWQCYGLGDHYNDTPTDYYEFAIPSTLNTVKITGGKYIAPGAFSNCRYLRNITITGNDATEIGNYAFYDCTALKSFEISNKITTIGKQAFQRCYNLMSITIPDSVTKIKHNAFSKCISASKASIPSSVTDMGKLVFEDFISGIITTTLTEGEIESRNWDTEWANSGASIIYEYNEGSMFYINGVQLALCGSGNDKYLFLVQYLGGWDSVTKLYIPGEVDIDGVTYNLRKIGPSIFSSNKTVEEIEFGKGVEVIGAHSFEYCPKLRKITFPEGIEEIGTEAFVGCTLLDNVDLKGAKKIGISAFKDCYGVDDYGNKTGLKTLDFGEGVEEIGDSAFENCEVLATSTLEEPVSSNDGEIEKKLIIPASVKSIGERAFYNTFKYSYGTKETSDTYVSTIEFTEGSELATIGEYAFANMGVSSYTIEGYSDYYRINIEFHGLENLSEIPNYMFYSTYLGILRDFPQNLTRIGDYSFYYCYGFYEAAAADRKPIEFNKDLTYIGEYAFYYCTRYFFKFPEEASLKTIGRDAFYNCSYSMFTEANIPNSVTSIGIAAFASCSYLVTFHIPENETLTKLEDSFFSGCTNLAKNDGGEITIPDNITKLGSSVFASCVNLKKITFKSSITEMGSSVFSSCTALENIEWNDGLESCSKFGSNVYYRCYRLDVTDMIIPTLAVAYVPSSTFFECTQITSYNASSKTGFRDRCFYGCENLVSVTYTESITHVYSSAFQGCKNLKTFSLPDQVYAIGDNAFAGCVALEEFTIPSLVTQAWDSSTSRGMGATPFSGWDATQTIYFNKISHVESVDPKTGNIKTVWGWTLINKTGYYTCSASGSPTVHFVQAE